MRIALLLPGGVDRSGEYRVIPALLALIERLSARHDVQVVALRQEDHAGQWSLAGARIHNIGLPRSGWRALAKIAEIHREMPFDLVHAFWVGSSGAAAALIGKYLRIPSIIHVGGGELVALPGIGYGGARSWWGRVREPLVLRSVSAVTAASGPMIDSLARLGIAATRIPLGVDLRAWPPREPAVRDGGRPARLIHIASLNRVKDQTTLLRAMQLLLATGPPFTLDIVGADTLNGAMQSLAGELGLAAKVRFHGFLTHRALRPILDGADLLVMSSLHESGPLALLEAAVAGVPAVGTAVGHFAEWAPRAALSAPCGDAPSLASCVRRLLSDEALRLQIAHAAQRCALAENADHTAQAFETLYAQLLQ